MKYNTKKFIERAHSAFRNNHPMPLWENLSDEERHEVRLTAFSLLPLLYLNQNAFNIAVWIAECSGWTCRNQDTMPFTPSQEAIGWLRDLIQDFKRVQEQENEEKH